MLFELANGKRLSVSCNSAVSESGHWFPWLDVDYDDGEAGFSFRVNFPNHPTGVEQIRQLADSLRAVADSIDALVE